MPRRDPETGKFVSGTGMPPYDDCEVQTIRTDMRWAAADLTGATQANGAGDAENGTLGTFDVAGGLSRGEVAELVHLRGTVNLQSSATQTADGSAFAFNEISASPERELKVGPYEGVGGSDLDVALGDHTDPDTLYVGVATAGSNFSDGSTGVGGGGSEEALHIDVPYREYFGQGPTFDRHNDLFQHVNVGANNIDDGSVQMRTALQAVWYVAEE